PGFLDGDVSVQDKSAQQAALLLDVAPGMRVLDACAAPGGKTGHLLELVDGDLDLTALDVSGQRLTRVRENLERLDYSATLIEGDATQPGDWWDGRLFDRILVDAPCSGTGVIRRHPDIKLHRKPSDISRLADLQADMLGSLWKLLAPGGKLLYCTCSVLAAENDKQLSRFIATTADATPVAVGASYAHETRFGRQVITGTNGMDGFYYGCLQKNAP
ncbi:MAG: 16S rRNA (cytosine(967)-C(5))-methyltransferase, partial [Gammaproteobacteria bacterium]